MPGLDRPLICPVLIGRDAELSALSTMLTGPPPRAPRVVCIGGEAGIGKSRLIGAVLDLARERGWLGLLTRCYEQDRGLAYSAPGDLVRQLADSPAAAAALANASGTLMRLLPHLRDVIPRETSRDEPLEPEQETRRLFAATAGALSAVAGDQPCLLVVEDVHWADAGTLDWLAFLARRRAGTLVIAVTFRSDEIGARLRHLLATLERERLSAELSLAPLSLTEVDSMVRATLADEAAVRADALQTLYHRAEGNPFLVEELLRSALADSPAPGLSAARLAEARIPLSVQDALSERIARLSPAARELLSVAAVIGDHFDGALLEAVAGLTADELLPRLRELAEQQLLIEKGRTFAFRHALTRDGVLAGVLANERRTQHARVADALLALVGEHSEVRTEDLAYHCFEAGRWEPALVYAQLAGEHALAVYAPGAAIDQFTRAISAADHGDLRMDPSILLGRARGYDALADFESARADFEGAIAQASAAGDVATLQDALLELALLWSSRDYTRSGDYLDHAVEVARGRRDPAALAHALNRLANWYSNTGHYTKARANLDEALTLARVDGGERLIAETLDLLGMTCLLNARFGEALPFLVEAAERFGRLGDHRQRSSPLASTSVMAGTYQTGMYTPALTLVEAATYAEAGLEAARASGAPTAIAYALWQLGFLLVSLGQHARAFVLANEALQIAEQNGHRQWALAARIVLGVAHLDLLRPEEAVPLLQAAHEGAQDLASAIWIFQSAALLADALLAGGRIEEAGPLVEQKLGMFAAANGMNIAKAWFASVAVDLALARDDYATALTILDRELPGERGVRTMRGRGRALLGLGRSLEARDALETAAGLARTQGDVAAEWRVLADLAHARLSAGQRAEARVAADAAMRLVEMIGAGLDDDAIGNSFIEGAALTLPASLRRRVVRGGTDGLSTRELEVARLVARGLSNRAIAEELVLGVRTVETHVANAMGRLGRASRAGLAAWVVEHGLLERD